MARIQVLLVKPEEEPTVVKVQNDLTDMQNLVDGNTTAIQIGEGLVMICNEEGNHLDDNLSLVAETSKGYEEIDTLKGNIFFASLVGENLHSLDKLQLKQLRERFITDSDNKRKFILVKR